MDNNLIKNKLEIFDEFIEHYIKSTKTIFRITCIVFISFVVTMSINIKLLLADVTKISTTQLIDQIMLFYQALIPEFDLKGKALFGVFLLVIIAIPLLYIHISKDFANFRVNFKIAIINGSKTSPTSNMRQMFKFYKVFMMLNFYAIIFIILLSNAIYLNILDIGLINIFLEYLSASAMILLVLILFKSKEEEETLNNILK